jgi:hypothetical protein
MKRLASGLLVVAVTGLAAASVSAGRSPAPPCLAAQLKPKLGTQGAGGAQDGELVLTNVSRTSCSLLGKPVLELVGPGSFRLGARSDQRMGGSSAVRSLLPRRQAQAGVFWSDWCKRAPRAFVLTLPHNGGTLRFPPDGLPRCDGGRTSLAVGPFENRAP